MKIKVYVDSDEWYPVYTRMTKKASYAQVIELTKEEKIAWDKCSREFTRWQHKIEKLVEKSRRVTE